MTTMTPRPLPVTGPGETDPPTPCEPIYQALATHWVAEGRVVPGPVEREWAMLAGSCPWPIR